MHMLSAHEATRHKFNSFHLNYQVAGRVWQQVHIAAQPGILLATHAALAAISYLAAVIAVSEARTSGWTIQVVRQTLFLVMIVRVIGAASVHLHRRSLRYANALDLLAITKAVLASSVLLYVVARWRSADLSIPSAVFLLDAALLILVWSAFHFGGRVLRARSAVKRKAGKPVIVVGAGDAGITVVKELALDSGSLCRPVAIVDDDPQKWGRSIYGIRVAGATRELARITAETGAGEILICVPSADRSQMRQILDACRLCGVPVKMLPSISELVDGKVTRQDFRRPRIEDLLQKHPIEIDARETKKVVGGRNVLVTGAGGSIGSELCRQIADADPRKLLLLDRSENSLFYIHLEARQRMSATRVQPFLVDLLQGERLREIMNAEKPEIVFHAAAHKHVGLLELHPEEAIRNNVIGTRNAAQAAIECGAARFVNISTDKAVKPQNYMGLSKKITELCIQEMVGCSGVNFSNVRFGNVAGSTGSVLRLFWDQIQMGKPIRVTDPRATRYFMTIPEAVHLILRAAALGRGGETFVFQMGEPLNIYELARTMMLFGGIRPEEDLRIEFTGLKPGEKVAEELWESYEHATPTECERILAIRGVTAASRGILARVRQMEEFIARKDHDKLLALLREVAPEFPGCQWRKTGDAGHQVFTVPMVVIRQTQNPRCEGMA